MTKAEALQAVADEARKLAEAVSHDDNGSMVAGVWVGGNGGLLSRETIRAADRVRLALNALDQVEEATGTC